MKNNKLYLILLGGIAVSFMGCTVQPWERGNLAKPQMALSPYPTQATFRNHNYRSREAGVGQGNQTGGGGCGCY